jgi:hypothetical protein
MVWNAEKHELLLELGAAECPEWLGPDDKLAFVRAGKEICIHDRATGRTEVVYTAPDALPAGAAPAR